MIIKFFIEKANLSFPDIIKKDGNTNLFKHPKTYKIQYYHLKKCKKSHQYHHHINDKNTTLNKNNKNNRIRKYFHWFKK